MKKRTVLGVLFAFMLMFPAIAYAQTVCTEHDFQPFETAPTCESSGCAGSLCTICGQTEFFTNLEALGHDFGEWTTAEDPTCSSEGLMRRICTRCSAAEEAAIEKLDHTCTTRLYAPTCGRDGYTLHTCTVCGYEERTDTVEKLGHNYIVTVIVPTCTADGYTRHKCANCGDAYRTDHQEKTGHLYDGGVETKEPTLTAMGRITYTCQYCGDTYQETTPKWIDPFEDLDKKQFYYNAVLWAYNSGISTGTDSTHFSPDGLCTRAQVVTFLWREAGSPEPSRNECPFLDVASESYYEKAVLWAVEQGITNGVDAAHFAPEQSCTRSQIVTFLYRAKGSPKSAEKEPFSDVTQTDYFFYAVCWAYENGVTTGTGVTSFSPKAGCSRAQIVTFLYRARKL